MIHPRFPHVAALGGLILGLCGLSAYAGAQEITRKEFDELKQELESVKRQVESFDTTLKSLNAALPAITQRLTELEALQRNVDILNDKLESVAVSDGDSVVPSILGNMEKSPSFRQQMGKVLQGKILVNNTTGVDQFLHINGVRWRAPAGLSYTYVPYGTVQTQLGPYDPVREWTVQDWKYADNGHQLEIGIQW